MPRSGVKRPAISRYSIRAKAKPNVPRAVQAIGHTQLYTLLLSVFKQSL